MNRTTLVLAALAGAAAACSDAPLQDSPRAATPLAPAFAVGGKGTSRDHFVANGDLASAEWGTTDASGSVLVSVYVSRTGPKQDQRTYLQYDVTRCDASDPAQCTSENGWGDIPNEDLTGSAASGLHLRTNTAANPDIEKNGPGGPLVLDWRKTGEFAGSFSGTSVHRTPAYVQRTQGRSTQRSAVASGAVLGVPVTGGYADLGTSHEVSIQVVRDTAGFGPVLEAGLASAGDAPLDPRAVTGPAVSRVESRFTANGDGGLVMWRVEDENGTLMRAVSVTRGLRAEAGVVLRAPPVPPIDQPGTRLSYLVVRCDLSDDCTVIASGDGVIPDHDLTGSGPGGLHLRTNTAGLEDFTRTGAGGVIEVDWRRTGLSLDSRRGTLTLRTPTYRERVQGAWTLVSATASGEFFGAPIPSDVTAEVMTTHQVSMTVERER